MRLTAKADYAVRAAVELAASEGQLVKADDLARRQDIPRQFLDNILLDLRRAGIVTTQRGSEGGSRLARPASSVNVADVMRAIEGPLAAVRDLRPEQLEYEGAAADLPKVWIAVRASLRAVLEHVTLADVAQGRLPQRSNSCSPTQMPGNHIECPCRVRVTLVDTSGGIMTIDVQTLADRLEIHDVLIRYSTALDTRDWKLLWSVFSDDAVLDYDEAPPASVAEFAERAQKGIGDLPATQHTVTNISVELDGDRARSRCYASAMHVRGEERATYLLGGVYLDELVRTPDGWRISHRNFTSTWATLDVNRRSGDHAHWRATA